MKRKTATARDQRQPPNIGKGGKKSRCQPPAERELRKLNRNFSVPTSWNGKSGIPRRVVRLFRKISGRTTRFICIRTGQTRNFAYRESTLVYSSHYTQPHPIVKYTRHYKLKMAFDKPVRVLTSARYQTTSLLSRTILLLCDCHGNLH